MVVHHIDDDSGVVTPSVVESFVADAGAAEYYICGPGPFMDTVEDTVLGSGVPRERVHLERFSVEPIPSDVAQTSEQTEEVVIELDRKTTTADVPGGQHAVADRADRGPAGAVVVRNRFVRNVHGTHRFRQRPDAQQRRTR